MGTQRGPRQSGTLSDRLCRLLTEQGWTYRALATQIGKSHGTIRNWCRGSPVSDQDVERLAVVLCVSAPWLRYGSKVDRPLLTRVIKTVEAVLTERRTRLSAGKRAHIVALAYTHAEDSGGHNLKGRVRELVGP
ncbi:MAG: helix-turn-helix transcriptional regulator [Gammaproteobacteria bacterium]|nr:helix-turn-helix transcriptional regulator [Gammaproteobacteria bacterium]